MIIYGKELFLETQNIFNRSSIIVAFSPYIKHRTISELLKTRNSKDEFSVITTWKPHDILNGYSDLEVYETIKEKGGRLFINNRIHLKAFIEYGKDALVGSNNITHAGLGISENFNHEAAVKINLDLDDNIYFDSIIEDSILVNDQVYSSVKTQLQEYTKNNHTVDSEFEIINEQMSFLLSA
ncbi:MAG: hypothetical protein OEV66_07035 [Spirochaetia bacterium]|nr:hypothetical protein [Spirochaetia bacterium]